MHENPNVIGVQSRKFSLTSEIFHDDFHHESILVFKEPERKKPFCFIYLPRFDVRLIIVFIQILCLVPFLSHILNLCCVRNDGG